MNLKNIYGNRTNGREVQLKKTAPKKFHLIFLNKTHPFFDRICRTYKIFFFNDDNNERIKMMI